MPKPNYSKILSLLSSLRGTTLVVPHSTADVDAVASAVALAKLIKATPVLLDSPSTQARKVLAYAGVSLPVEKNISSADNLVLVDFNSPQLAGGRKKELLDAKNVVCVDHHAHSDKFEDAVLFIDEGKCSCSEIILDLYHKAGKTPDKTTAFLLLAGVISDSAGFKSANTSTFSAVSELFSLSKADYRQVYSLLNYEPDFSEKLVLLNSVKTSLTIRAGHYLIGYSFEKAFASKACVALLSSGCDVAFSVNKEKGKISCVKHSHVKQFSVGKMFEEYAGKFGGSGGGHDAIGGCTVEPKKTVSALNYFLKFAFDKLK
ncbi:DHH family phosphoesterase [Candidatus Micrarchaeota archaeon]|nr:DHH family phosphoesterase [Candidatus Micrarchaeota archaeon]